jgi:hypothetical protein
MALKAGAAHVDFVDVNPRAADFQRDNAARNNFPASLLTSITGDIAEFTPEGRYDLILANPPFVPTPDGIEGTLTSNGGPEGNRLAEILLARLDELLEPGGRALIYLFQVTKEGQPLIVEQLTRFVPRRPVALTPAQERPIPFEVYGEAYRRLFPEAVEAIDRWCSDLAERWGRHLALSHYVVDMGPQSEGPSGCVIREDFAEKFGESFLAPFESDEKLAFARVFENFVPDS